MSRHNCMSYSPGNLECAISWMKGELWKISDGVKKVYKRLVKEHGKLVENKKKL